MAGIGNPKGTNRGGGITPGQKTRRTKAAIAGVDRLCKEYGYDPLGSMIKEAADPNTDPAVRRELHKEIAPYIYPKRKAIEVSGDLSLTAKAYVNLPIEALFGTVIDALEYENGPENDSRRPISSGEGEGDE